ncbi:MAG: hypothetical protein KGI57_09470, partial [Hyphomicrobiales bacterium]|nr:hypothetical protein [Hyphomicrobiales bacterium]
MDSAKPFRRIGRVALVVALAFAAPLAATTPARAQFFNFFRSELSPDQVMRMVEGAGMRPFSPVYRSGPDYVIDVLSPDGKRRRLVIDTHSGRVVDSFILWTPPAARRAPPQTQVLRPPAPVPDAQPPANSVPMDQQPPLPKVVHPPEKPHHLIKVKPLAPKPPVPKPPVPKPVAPKPAPVAAPAPTPAPAKDQGDLSPIHPLGASPAPTPAPQPAP